MRSRRNASIAAPAEAKRTKLGEQVARRIEDRILAEGWPVGHRLGSEADLAAAAGVGRWTFREAQRLLEHSGLVVSRRGAGGGLFVAAPMLDVVANGLSNYLEFVRADPSELIGIYDALRALALNRAACRLDGDAREPLRRLRPIIAGPDWADAFDATDEVSATILRAAGNPALTLLTRTLSRIVLHAAWYSTLDDEAFHGLFPPILKASGDLVEHLLRDDLPEARAADRVMLEKWGRLLEASSAAGRLPTRPGATERAYRVHPPSRPSKKADRIARELCETINAAGWPVGLNLGSEAELMERFGVGRSVMREAIRSLERLGVVSMGRGRANGLKVMSPDPDLIVEACRRYLRRAGVSGADLDAVKGALTKVSGDAAAWVGGGAPEERGMAMEVFHAVLAV